MRCLGSAHGSLVHERRIRVLAAAAAALIPPGSCVLDVGAGDGRLGALVAASGRQLRVEGFDVLVRDSAAIPVRSFDGERLPVDDGAADVVMLIDVLHHAANPIQLLSEAARAARGFVIIKDHRTGRPGAKLMLRLMDWVGNRAHGVALPYGFWSDREWREAWDRLGLRLDRYQVSLGLYPWPANWIFELGLHFLARLACRSEAPRQEAPEAEQHPQVQENG